jgi:photosystem II stability/assembly factor-like uncharacterized protein
MKRFPLSNRLVITLLCAVAAVPLSWPVQAATPGPVYDQQLYQALEWRSIGPYRGGRVTAVAGHVDQPFTFYMGATGGGLWKTNNGGVTWENVSDGFFNTGTIGGIAVAPSDPNVIYVGTGESPVRGVTTSHGDGVYKSTDAGKTWQHSGLELTRQIAKVVVDPRNPQVVFVAAQGSPWAATEERGIYRSTDGGASWQRVLFVDSNTGASFLTIDPGNPRVLYASMWDHRRKPWTVTSGGPGSGLWKTTDGGDHWVRLTRGLPELMGNTAAAVSPANPNRVYAMIEAVEGGVFRSDDAGETWKRVNSDNGIRDRGWYYTHIFADPQDENTVYVLANATVKSIDGGVTFQAIQVPHGDTHDLWINPEHPQWMIHSNDGGANVTYDGGQSWSSNMNQPTGQLYRVIADNRFPYNLYAGQQDNSTVRIPSRTFDAGIGQEDLHVVAGGESAQIAFDPDNPELVYGTSILGTIELSNEKTGEVRDVEAYPYFSGFRPGRELKLRFNWNAPVVVSMHDPKVVYHGANKVLRSTDRGQSWTVISPDLTRDDVSKQGTTGGPISIEGAGGETYGTLMYIAESPHDANTIWTGSDDGLVQLTRDGGASWQNVTPAGLPECQVNMVEVSPHDPATAYIAATLYKFNDFTPHIYRTSDYGKHWQRIVAGIDPQAFVRVVREDPLRKGLLYAGTEAGVYVSFNDGGTWQPLQLNLPRVPVTDLRVHQNDLLASTQGRAFWILDDITPLQQLDARVAASGTYVFKPKPTYRAFGGGWGWKPGKNPPNGVVLRYLLGKPPAGGDDPLKLEILDAQGSVIRTFSSAAAAEEKDVLVKGVQGDRPPPPLPAKAGMNSYVWDLKVERLTPVDNVIRYVSAEAYRVAPGTYTARLTHNGESVTQTFEVLPNPLRAPIAAEDWERQQALLANIWRDVNEVHRLANQSRSIAAQVREVIMLSGGHARAADISARGNALMARLEKWLDQEPQAELPGGVQDYVSVPNRLLSTQYLYLKSAVDQDPPVTAGAEQRYAEISQQWAGMKADLQRLLAADLADFDKLLDECGLGHIIVP